MSSRVYNYNNEELNLTILQEECAEVIQIVAKIKRFGWDSIHPEGGPNNRAKLAQEIGDVKAMINILTAHGSVAKDDINRGKTKKLSKLANYYEFK